MRNIAGICLGLIFASVIMISCAPQPESSSFSGAEGEVQLITLAPGHFHAHLVQKSMYDQVSPMAHIYAPDGPELDEHIARIESYNNRQENPTAWVLNIYRGEDYLERMISERKGNVVMLAGNNRNKTHYIKSAVANGYHVLSDKPMVINTKNFHLLKEAFKLAEQNQVLLYDIMTERYEITSVLQKELMKIPGIFGELEKGTPDCPSVVKESVHHLFKYVAGSILKRPPWFFDVTQQGEGIIDVTTHLVDLIQWACFPEQILDYENDIHMLSANRWPTRVTLSEFESITRLPEFPGYLDENLMGDSILEVYCNGEMNYTLKGVHARVVVRWDYRAPEGTGDTHYSIMRGSRANLVIRQGEEEDFKPVLYIEPIEYVDAAEYAARLPDAFRAIQEKFPGIELEAYDSGWKLNVPEHYRLGHEAHFAQVTAKYLQFLVDGKLPDWEVPNMISKYYTTTKALEMALDKR